MLQFRDLRADEIDCRVSTISEKGLALLLYKDARCDMNILDETVGAYNWQRSHSRDNANCTVSIWDEGKSQWISKEDVGTESNTEAQKGLASDSFKRACFNWGIGRELYTAPFIWVKAENCRIANRNNDGKYVCYDKFSVESITIKNKKIVGLAIKNDGTGNVVFSMGKAVRAAAQNVTAPKVVEPTETFRQQFRRIIAENNVSAAAVNALIAKHGLTNESPDNEWGGALAELKGIVEAMRP